MLLRTGPVRGPPVAVLCAQQNGTL